MWNRPFVLVKWEEIYGNRFYNRSNFYRWEYFFLVLSWSSEWGRTTLAGFRALDSFMMTIDLAKNKLTAKDGSCEILLTWKGGHLYIVWDTDLVVLFTEGLLHRVFLHFFHPVLQGLYAILRRARPGDSTSQTLQQLERIESSWDMWQRLGQGPRRFKVTLPDEEVVLNRLLCIQLFTIEEDWILNNFDKETKFKAAEFLSSEATVAV